MLVYISATLRNYFGKHEKIEVQADSIKKILEFLTDEYPDSKNILFDDNNQLRSFIQIYVGDDNKTHKDYWNDSISKENEVLILPAIAGGAPEESIISKERAKAVAFDDAQVDRYSKHLMLKEIGVKGQKRIRAARIVVAGVGALGSPVIQYLAAAGVGTIKVIDFDEVSIENLQNQVLHTSRDLKRPKVASARDKVRNIDRSIVFEDVNLQLEAENIVNEIDGYDLVIDCTDNYKARYLINDACVLIGIPFVFGAIYHFEGQVGVFNYNNGPCLRCLYPAPPEPGLVPTCSEGGSISTLGGIIGSIQANEALKLIIGIGEHLDGRLLVIDSLYLHSRVLHVDKNHECPLCGYIPSISSVEDFDYEDFCGLREDESEEPIESIEPDELARRIEEEEPITFVDVREPHERAVLRFPNSVVIPIGQLARRQNELNPDIDTIFICKQGKRSEFAIRTLREAGYEGPMYNLKGGLDAMKDIVFSHEGAWL